MTAPQKLAIHSVLMRNLEMVPNDQLYVLLSGAAWGDADALAPIIDEWIQAGYRAGLNDRGLSEAEILHLGERK